MSADRTSRYLDPDDILDAAADSFVNDGFDAITFRQLAHRLDVDTAAIEAHFESVEQLLVSMLNREYADMFRTIADDIERDPLGGRLSRVYQYVLSGVHVRPLARALYLMDRDGLNRIMRATHGYAYVPQFSVRAELIERMKEAGVVRRDVDAETLSAVISAVSAGAALLPPQPALEQVVHGLQRLLERAVDTDQLDTSEGKRAFLEYASSLTPGEIER